MRLGKTVEMRSGLHRFNRGFDLWNSNKTYDLMLWVLNETVLFSTQIMGWIFETQTKHMVICCVYSMRRFFWEHKNVKLKGKTIKKVLLFYNHSTSGSGELQSSQGFFLHLPTELQESLQLVFYIVAFPTPQKHGHHVMCMVANDLCIKEGVWLQMTCAQKQ